MIRAALACTALLSVAACANLPAPDAAAVDARAVTIEADIVKACIADGLFRPVVRAGVTIFVPAGSMPLGIAEAGVDQVCAHPARYAHDASTAVWVARNLRDIVKAQAEARR